MEGHCAQVGPGVLEFDLGDAEGGGAPGHREGRPPGPGNADGVLAIPDAPTLRVLHHVERRGVQGCPKHRVVVVLVVYVALCYRSPTSACVESYWDICALY